MDLIEIGSALGLGIVVGLIARQAVKLVLMMLAALVLILLGLQYLGVVAVNWQSLFSLAASLVNALVGFFQGLAGGHADLNVAGDLVTFLLGFAGGLYIGGKI